MSARVPMSRLYGFWFRDVGGDWLLCTDTNKARLRRELRDHRLQEYATTNIAEYRCYPSELSHITPGRYGGKVWPR